jgi:hypothetical protein
MAPNPHCPSCCAEDHDHDGSSQQPSPCVWEQKNDFLERLQLDLQDEWTSKEQKAAHLIVELRAALGTVVDENDDLMDDVQELLHTCETLNLKNKSLTRENREIEEAHEAVTVIIRELVIAVEEKEDMWQHDFAQERKEWKHERRVLDQELRDTRHELKQLKQKQMKQQQHQQQQTEKKQQQKEKQQQTEKQQQQQKEKQLQQQLQHQQEKQLQLQQQEKQLQLRHIEIDTSAVMLDQEAKEQLVNTVSHAREVEVERQKMNEYAAASACRREHILRQRQQDYGGTSNSNEGSASTDNTRSSTKSGSSHATTGTKHSATSRNNSPSSITNSYSSRSTTKSYPTVSTDILRHNPSSTSDNSKATSSSLTKSLKTFMKRHGGVGSDISGSSRSMPSNSTWSKRTSRTMSGDEDNHSHQGHYANTAHDHADQHDHDATEKRLLDVTKHNAAAKERRERMDLRKLLLGSGSVSGSRGTDDLRQSRNIHRKQDESLRNIKKMGDGNAQTFLQDTPVARNNLKPSLPSRPDGGRRQGSAGLY